MRDEVLKIAAVLGIRLDGLDDAQLAARVVAALGGDLPARHATSPDAAMAYAAGYVKVFGAAGARRADAAPAAPCQCAARIDAGADVDDAAARMQLDSDLAAARDEADADRIERSAERNAEIDRLQRATRKAGR